MGSEDPTCLEARKTKQNRCSFTPNPIKILRLIIIILEKTKHKEKSWLRMIPTFRRQNVSRWKDGETRSCSHPLTLYMKTYLEPVLPLKFSVVGANYYPSV